MTKIPLKEKIVMQLTNSGASIISRIPRKEQRERVDSCQEDQKNKIKTII